MVNAQLHCRQSNKSEEEKYIKAGLTMNYSSQWKTVTKAFGGKKKDCCCLITANKLASCQSVND